MKRVVMNEDNITDEQRNEEDRILREFGYEPSELSAEERHDLLVDLTQEDSADNDSLRSATPKDEQDDTFR